MIYLKAGDIVSVYPNYEDYEVIEDGRQKAVFLDSIFELRIRNLESKAVMAFLCSRTTYPSPNFYKTFINKFLS